MTDNDRTDRVEVTQADRVALEDVTPEMARYFGDDLCLIWSGEHRLYWRANANGYTSVRERAGRYTLASAYAATRHCDPDKQIAFERLAALSGAGGEGDTSHPAFEGAMEYATGEAATHPGDHPGDAGEGSVAARLWTALDKLFVQAIQSELNDPAHEYGSAVIAEVRSLLEETKATALSPTSAPAGDGARREALKAASDKAKPGPWVIYEYIRGAYEICVEGNYASGGICQPHRRGDAEFIVAAVNYVRDILALSTQATDREKVLEEARLIERIRAAVTYQYMPMQVRKLLSEAATSLAALAQAPSEAGR